MAGKLTWQRVQLRTRLAKPPAIKRCRRKARPISSKEKQRKLQMTQRALSKACRIASRSNTTAEPTAGKQVIPDEILRDHFRPCRE